MSRFAITVRSAESRIDLVRLVCARCDASLVAEIPLAELWADVHVAPRITAAHGRIATRVGPVVGWYYPATDMVVRD